MTHEADIRILKLLHATTNVKPRSKAFQQLDDSLIRAQEESEVVFLFGVQNIFNSRIG